MRESIVAPLCPVPDRGGLADLVHINAEQAPDSIAFLRRGADGWFPVTAEEFRDQVERVARGLISSGVGAGDRVALLAATRYEWTLVDFALWSVGAVPVPVYVTSSQEQIEWILADSGAVAAIVETATHEAKISALHSELPHLRQVWRIDGDTGTAGAVEALMTAGRDTPPSAVERRRRAVTPQDIATIIYTSGTTGRPKGCVLTHANFFAEAGNAVELWRPMFGPADGDDDQAASTLLFLPLAHVFGRMVQVGSMRARATLGHTADVKGVLDDLAVFRPTFLLSVPYVLEKIFNSARQKAHAAGFGRIFDAAVDTAIAYSLTPAPGLRLRVRHTLFDKLVYRTIRAALGGRCRYAISGGAALGHRLTHFYRGIGLTVFEAYGLTESTAAATANSLGAFKPGTVGRPLPGGSVRISDDGEVLLKGGHVFPGYWNNGAATAEAFTGAWFATGDLGTLDTEGFLTITGRKKEILVTMGGKNVAPAVIEDRINAHPLISQAVVVGDGRKYIAALITLDPAHFDHWKTIAGKPLRATVGDLLDDADLNAEVQRAVDAGNVAVSTAESVRRFQILPIEFTPENGLLTPSLKLKRPVITKDFAAEIDGLYASAGSGGPTGRERRGE
ncbi:long-chain fatty acid--CoA ligase [Streptomyces sp. MUM 136J]|uniref:AMP-dependent synthetase/ligase n=1 Tax=Streptomyces sp. MUM 136J TaxID=2791992 RepID=UPI001F0455C5|nr:AMP-dependent synthetase/ligase [Streptomyces sp. MUM 136J]MCH0571644.1 long-chain fatty acid--CoA ligase [Streptomyces sp. MUM 136J]